MPDISQHTDPIVAAIYEQYEKTHGTEPARPYIGASIIGNECSRALWYTFRWGSKPEFDGRMYRLFQTGHLEEPRMIADLRAIGVTVWDVDPANGKQFSMSDHGGHMRGNCDGVAKFVPGGGQRAHLLEFKTHSAKSFSELKSKGVNAAKPVHYAQMTWYQGKMDLQRALYIAKNKDTDELYSERLEFDKVAFEQIQAKAERIIFACEPPPKIKDDPKYYLCSWCDHNGVCHGHRVPPVSCRTCVHATPERTPETEGRWSCAVAGHDSSIPIDIQRTGCPQHLPLPFLLTYAEPLDAGDGWVEFKRKDNGLHFFVVAAGVIPPTEHPRCSVCGEPQSETTSGPVCKNGHGGADAIARIPIYASQEVSAAKDHRVIANPEFEKFRTAFPGSRISG